MNLTIFSVFFASLIIFIWHALLFKRDTFKSTFLIYSSLLSVFFVFRASVLVLGVDEIFPEHIYYGAVEESDYMIGWAGYCVWIFIYLALVTFFGKSNLLPAIAAASIHEENGKALKSTFYLLFFLSLVYFTFALLGAGGMAGLIYYVRINSEFGYAFLSNIPSIAMMIGCVVLAIYGASRLVIVYVLTLGFIHICLGDRSGIIFSLVVLGYALWITNKVGVVRIVLLAPIIFVVAALLKWFRSVFQLEMDIADSGLIRALSSSLNLNVYDAYFIAVSYIQDGMGLRYGYDFWLGIVGLIPRFLWDGKPELINTGVWFAQLYSDLKMGTPVSSLGEWYMNFGFIGFVLGSLVTYLIIFVVIKILPADKNLKSSLGLIFVLHVLQSGFTNATLRELFLFCFFVLVPFYMMHTNYLRLTNENTNSK
jgi:hypothetical protein